MKPSALQTLRSDPGARSLSGPEERSGFASTTRPRLRGPRRCAVLRPAAPTDAGQGRRPYLASSPPALPGEPPPGGQRRARPLLRTTSPGCRGGSAEGAEPCLEPARRARRRNPLEHHYLSSSSLPSSRSRAGSRQRKAPKLPASMESASIQLPRAGGRRSRGSLGGTG